MSKLLACLQCQFVFFHHSVLVFVGFRRCQNIYIVYELMNMLSTHLLIGILRSSMLEARGGGLRAGASRQQSTKCGPICFFRRVLEGFRAAVL